MRKHFAHANGASAQVQIRSVSCVRSRSAAICHQQRKEQTSLTTKTTSIGSSKGNSIDEPQYEGNTIPL